MELTKEQRWEIFNNLPESLKDAIFSGDTAEAISSICALHNIEETNVIAKIIGKTLMGLFPPDKISEYIRKELPMVSENIANTVTTEIQHYIFDPVMEDLMSLYTSEKLEQLNSQEDIKPTENNSKNSYREKITE